MTSINYNPAVPALSFGFKSKVSADPSSPTDTKSFVTAQYGPERNNPWDHPQRVDPNPKPNFPELPNTSDESGRSINSERKNETSYEQRLQNRQNFCNKLTDDEKKGKYRNFCSQ